MRIGPSVLLFSLTILTEGLTYSAPKIAETNGVRTLASVSSRAALAQGSVFEVVGEKLGPVDAVTAELPLPTGLEGVAVKLKSSSGDVLEAYIVSVSATRILAIAPSSAAPGDYTATVEFLGEASNGYAVTIVETNFGMLTTTGGFGGMALGRIVTEEGPAAFGLGNAIPSGGATIEIDAAGLGLNASAPDNDLSPEANLFPDALLLIGGQEVAITYAGRNPSRPGYDRLLVTLPAEGLPTGCAVPATVRLREGLDSLTFALPLLAPDQTVCVHPLGLSPESLASLAAGGGLVRGGFYLNRVIGKATAGGQTFESNTDAFAGGFVLFSADAIAKQTAASLRVTAYDENNCAVYDSFEGEAGDYVDAGPSMKLVDPTWTIDVPRGTGPSLNQYNVVLENGLSIPGFVLPHLRYTPGKHVLTGTGGSFVGPFSVEINASGQFQWNNMDTTTEVDTSKDLTMFFSGAGPDDNIAGSGLVKGPAPEDPSKIVNRIWQCIVKGSTGKIVVSAAQLQKMPRVTAEELANPKSGRYSSLSIGQYNPDHHGEFIAPLTAGGNTEPTVFLFNYTYSKAPVPVK